MKKLAILLAFAACLSAQELDQSKLLKQPTDTRPMYNGDYSGQRYSPLTQINQKNVKSLTLAWAFQTHAQNAVYSTPLELNGILYVALPAH